MLPVSTNSDDLGAPHWINYVQNLGAVLELGLSGLVDKQRNCDDMYIRQLPMLGTKPNSQVEIRRALSMSNVKCNRIAPAITKNLEDRLITASTNDAGIGGTNTLTAASQVAYFADLSSHSYKSRSTPK